MKNFFSAVLAGITLGYIITKKKKSKKNPALTAAPNVSQ